MSEINQAQTPIGKTNGHKTSGKKMLLIMAVIFVLPFTLAATLHILNLKPSGHSYGSLIQPPRALQFPILHDAQGKPFSAQQWHKIWSVVMVDAASCAELCQKQAHMLKQVHTLLNKDAKRVQRILLVPAAANLGTINALQKLTPDLIVLVGADAAAVSFAGNFNVTDGGVYLVDPLGNLMMSYPPNLEQKGIFADLKRLLKNSWAG